MKILVVSDIHGAAEKLDKIIEYIKYENIERMIILGDTYSSMFFKSASDNDITKILDDLIINKKIEIIMIKGNCDSTLAYEESPVGLLEKYEFDLGNRHVLAFHGHHDYTYLKGFDIFLYGHSHVHNYIKDDGIIYLNPGSVGRPRDYTNGSFIIMDEHVVTFFDLDFTVIEEEKL